MYAATLGSMNYRQGWAALEIEKWQSWSEMTLRGGTASFCQIGIAHGARPKLGLGHSYSWDMGQGQSWGTVTG